jgi:hypothetical protein
MRFVLALAVFALVALQAGAAAAQSAPAYYCDPLRVYYPTVPRLSQGRRRRRKRRQPRPSRCDPAKTSMTSFPVGVTKSRRRRALSCAPIATSGKWR